METQQINPTPVESQPKPNHEVFYILVFIFITIMGSFTYLFYLNYNPTCIPDCSTIVVPIFDETDSWKIYEDKKSGFNFKYPNDWNIATSNITRINENALLFTGALIIQSTSSPSMGEIALAPVGGMWLSVVPVETCDDPSFDNVNSDFSLMTDLAIATKSICSGPFMMGVGLWEADPNFINHKIILNKILSTFKFIDKRLNQNTKNALLKVRHHGGLCEYNNLECSSRTTISADGSIVFQDGKTGQINDVDLNSLNKEINSTNYRQILEHKFTGTCPTAYDGTAVEYAFYTDKGVYVIDSCKVDIDEYWSVFQEINKILRKYTPPII